MCNACGIALCWDISTVDYRADKVFWDAWICQECNGGTPLSLKAFQQEQQPLTGA